MRSRLREKLHELHRRHHASHLGAFGDLLREPAPRVDRGTVRYLLLDAVAERPRHGYEILQAVAEKSGGVYRPSPGVVYPTLQMLEDMGFVAANTRDERKSYAITPQGKAELASHADEVMEFYERSADHGLDRGGDDLHDLLHRLRRLLHLFKRSVRQGRLTAVKTRKIRGVLDNAIDQLEELLGDGA